MLFLLVMASQCTPRNPSDVGNASPMPPALTIDTGSTDAAAPAQPIASWVYSRRRDELRNGEIVEATIRSSNSVDLGFPYGTVNLNLTVRRHPEWGLDVIFQVDEGQILCGIYDCAGRINFDGRAERLSLNESGDHNSAVVFARAPQAILTKLQRSRRVIVELSFFQNGNRQFTFDSAGLLWPPSSVTP